MGRAAKRKIKERKRGFMTEVKQKRLVKKGFWVCDGGNNQIPYIVFWLCLISVYSAQGETLKDRWLSEF